MTAKITPIRPADQKAPWESTTRDAMIAASRSMLDAQQALGQAQLEEPDRETQAWLSRWVSAIGTLRAQIMEKELRDRATTD